MTDVERAWVFDDFGPMSKTDLDILRNVLGERERGQETGVARVMVASWKAGRAFAEERERVMLEAIFAAIEGP